LFNDDLSANNALKIFNLYKDIEDLKIKNNREKPYLMHATYYIMFFIKKLSKNDKQENLIEIYNKSLKKIEYIIDKEKEKLKESYLDSVLFKSNRPKDYLTELKL
jgi:hypothetical protein